MRCLGLQKQLLLLVLLAALLLQGARGSLEGAGAPPRPQPSPAFSLLANLTSFDWLDSGEVVRHEQLQLVAPPLVEAMGGMLEQPPPCSGGASAGSPSAADASSSSTYCLPGYDLALEDASTERLHLHIKVVCVSAHAHRPTPCPLQALDPTECQLV